MKYRRGQPKKWQDKDCEEAVENRREAFKNFKREKRRSTVITSINKNKLW